MDPEFERIDRLLHHGDPEEAWVEVARYIERNAFDHGRWAEVSTLTEDLVFIHGDLYIDRIEATAEGSKAFQRAIGMAYIGGIAGPSVERFLALQERYGIGW